MKKRAFSLLLVLVMVLGLVPVTARADTLDNGLRYRVWTYIDSASITGCDSDVTAVVIPAEIEGWPVTSIDNYAFYDCPKLTSIDLPDSLTSIGNGAFNGCTSLISIRIPASVDRIGDYAFGSCNRLSVVCFEGNAPKFGTSVFYHIKSTVYYPADNPTWTADVMKDHGGDITWIPYDPVPFTDVPANSFYHVPVIWALENGITNGTSDTVFSPDDPCLRAHVVTFLHRAAKNPEPASSKNPFSDVKTSDFFYKPVLWAVEKGITNGTGGNKFGSYDVCNRAAVVTFLWRAAGQPEPTATENPFTDVKTTDFFYKAVLWAVENGITNGLDETHFGPTSPCNRAQVVTFLYRAYN